MLLLSFLLSMADIEAYQPCYQSTLLLVLQRRCGYSRHISCR